MTTPTSAILARYPGRCLCGATFAPGARIYWSAEVRRATGCPACATRKAIPGKTHELQSGLVVRFDRHPETDAVVLCVVMDPCGAWDAGEVYALVGGRWALRSISREPVLAGVATHEQIEGWRAETNA